jgi:hypothetical protein
MAEKRKLPKMTPEEIAQRERTTEMVRERIAYHEAKAREEEEARARAQSSWLNRLRLRVARVVAP